MKNIICTIAIAVIFSVITAHADYSLTTNYSTTKKETYRGKIFFGDKYHMAIDTGKEIIGVGAVNGCTKIRTKTWYGRKVEKTGENFLEEFPAGKAVTMNIVYHYIKYSKEVPSSKQVDELTIY